MAVTGSACGTWTVAAIEDRCSSEVPPAGRLAASVTLDTATAWRLCTRGIEPTSALSRARIEGCRGPTEVTCHIVSVVH